MNSQNPGPMAPARHAYHGPPHSASSPHRRHTRDRHRRSWGSRIVGGTGEILITLGVLGLLFVVWELWWTGIEAENDRQDTLDEFYAASPEGAGPDGESAPEDERSAPVTSGPADFETCYTLDDGTEIGCAPHMRAAADAHQVMGTLYAPRLGSQWAAPVREGVEAEQIDRGGVGRYPSTQFPDERGNLALAGHRNTYASMLGRQDELQIGDRLYLVSWDGMYTYEVSERLVVSPTSTEVLASHPGAPGTDPETGMLTLTTCHPLYSNAQRLIHHAEIVDFTPLGGEVPAELAHHGHIAEMFAAPEGG